MLQGDLCRDSERYKDMETKIERRKAKKERDRERGKEGER